MLPQYVPVIRAKKGEFDAMQHLGGAIAQKILPLFELPRYTRAVAARKKFSGLNNPVETYVDELTQKIAECRKGMAVMIDIFKWPPNANVENGLHVMAYAYSRLRSMGVPVYPVVGYDRWDDPGYQRALAGIELVGGDHFCLRLDSYALEDMQDEMYFEQVVQDILERLQIEPQNCNVIIDMGDVTNKSIPSIQEEMELALSRLSKWNFKFLSIAGCSLPPSVADAVAQKDSTGMVLRREMIAWQAIRRIHPNRSLIFGDYGIRNPNSAEDVRNPNINGKIRYTVSQGYFVVRGHSMQQMGKGEQYYGLAETLIRSANYLGESFSWGDNEIFRCANQEFMGSSTQWVAIDTNHHLKVVVLECIEFERTLEVEPLTVSVDP